MVQIIFQLVFILSLPNRCNLDFTAMVFNREAIQGIQDSVRIFLKPPSMLFHWLDNWHYYMMAHVKINVENKQDPKRQYSYFIVSSSTNCGYLIDSFILLYILQCGIYALFNKLTSKKNYSKITTVNLATGIIICTNVLYINSCFIWYLFNW